MSWLAVFVLVPLLVAAFRGRATGWQLAAALLMVAVLFSGQLGTAAVLWASMLVLAVIA